MLLMPPNTSMVQARDAVLAADLMRFGGANQKELWLGFARAGLGRTAASTNGGVNSDTDPLPDFDAVGTTPANVKFEAKGLDGTALNARIYVGHYEARISPIADTNPATTASSNVDDTAAFAPGTYEFVAHVPGYGHVRFRETFRSGRDKTIRIEFPTNWASTTSGATATTADGAATVAQPDRRHREHELERSGHEHRRRDHGEREVGGHQPRRDRSRPGQVRPGQRHAGPGNSRFSALRSFEIWACNNGGSLALKTHTPPADCSTDAGFKKVYSSGANAFPGSAPRPIAPQLILRRFDVPDFNATHVKLVVKTSQCTGGSAVPGRPGRRPDEQPGLRLQRGGEFLAEPRPHRGAAGLQEQPLTSTTD